MAIYAFISGYGICRSANRGNLIGLREKLESDFSYAIRHWLGLMKKYWIVFFIFVPLSAAVGKLELGGVKLFLLSVIGWSAKYCGSWWYVRQYIAMLIVFPMLNYILMSWKDNRNIPVRILFGILIAGIILWCKFITGGHYYTFIFITGFVIARFHIFETINHIFETSKVLLALSVTMLVACIYIRAYITPTDGNFGIFEWLLTPLFIFFISLLFENVSLLSRPKKVLVFLGQYSTYMWLSHEFFCYKFLPRFIAMGKYSTMMYAEVFAVSLLAAVLLTKLEKKINLTTLIKEHHVRKTISN